jgi:CubicO group peptidase (beta-lactamase class C family)
MTRRTLLLSSLGFTLRRKELDEAVRLIETQTEQGEISAAVLDVRRGKDALQRSFGKAKSPDAIFILASITKPMTAAGVMLLADRGAISINDPVSKYIPEFKGGDRSRVLIRHLLTHTSGLPDMLAENVELRKHHAPLKDFVAGACRTPLLFPPGTQMKYQSMGILLASEIVQRVTGIPFPDYLRKEIFLPLGMQATSLGLGGRKISDTMIGQVDKPTDWDGNSPYWRSLGNPWGGVHSTASDVSRFLWAFANPEKNVLKPATVEAMITNQNAGLNEAWGIGWSLENPTFGSHCSKRTYGHLGASGTIAWLDPATGLSLVLLTTEPLSISEKRLLKPVSDLVSAAAA